MSFVRIKKIKNQEYAYLVRNLWTEKGCRQKVGKYLGKALCIQKKANEPHILTKETYKERILELIKQELLNYGFYISENRFKLDDIEVAVEQNKVIKKNKNVVLKLNEGFMCTETLTQLREFSPTTKKDLEILANLLVEVGIKIEKELFLQLCEPLIAKSKEPEKPENQFYY